MNVPFFLLSHLPASFCNRAVANPAAFHVNCKLALSRGFTRQLTPGQGESVSSKRGIGVAVYEQGVGDRVGHDPQNKDFSNFFVYKSKMRQKKR